MRGNHDPKALLIAATAATIAYAGALVGHAVPGTGLVLPAGTAAAPAAVQAFRAEAGSSRAAKKRVALGSGALEQAEAAVRAQLSARAFPGAALAIGREDRSVVEKGMGKLAWGRGMPSVDPGRTVYDLASLTKVVATTAAVMALYEDGKIDLDAPVRRYLPEFTGGGKDQVTIRHLLTHTAGLPAGTGASGARDEALRRVVGTRLVRAPGEAVEYSDVGFIVLWEAAGRAAGEPLFKLLDRRVYGPLKMRSTTFTPGRACVTCAPTWVDGEGSPVRGIVHDPTARKLGGITGNAGLFSTAHDVGRFAAMLANGGELDGVRVYRTETIGTFATPQPGAGKRALGWDTPGEKGTGGAGLKISKRAFGHTGFTGTSLWVDRERGTWTVLLANRTYEPQTPNRMQSLRRKVNDNVAVAADAVDDSLAALGE